MLPIEDSSDRGSICQKKKVEEVKLPIYFHEKTANLVTRKQENYVLWHNRLGHALPKETEDDWLYY